ncbi:MAG: DUF4389 domain-containing protein [Methanomicrobiales archaeon]|nr:DUF4389 domain-containing protein [Methanomicrobiales archaeon]
MDAATEGLKELFTYEHDARRLELLIRIVYTILISIVLAVYGFVSGICTCIQFFVILVLGRRSRGLSEFVRGYLEYYVHVFSYTSLMTDTRPGILPKTVRIYKKELPPSP